MHKVLMKFKILNWSFGLCASFSRFVVLHSRCLRNRMACEIIRILSMTYFDCVFGISPIY